MKVISRFIYALCVLLAGVSLVAGQDDTRKPAPRRPSVVLIIADDLGYGDLGCYGQKDVRTPNLDKLAAEGVRFTSFYGTASTGAGSRASILTGLNAAHLGPTGNMLPEDTTTISQLLRSSGYRTGFIGQWGLNGLPENKSFDQVVALLPETEEFSHYPETLWRADAVVKYTGAEKNFPENANGLRSIYIPELLTTAGMNFIQNNKPELFNKYRSFFLCLSYNVPHARFDLVDTGDYADKSWPPSARTKAAMITRLDAEVGAIRDRLNSTGQTNNVMIIFLSGNGPDTNVLDPKFLKSTGTFRGGKGSLYEGGLRVPMIVWFPARITPGVISTPWTAADLTPTLADIAWEKPPEKIDGLSLWPALLRQSTNVHESLYWENSLTGARAVRMGDWKAVRPAAGAQWELYDLKTDSREKADVAAKNPDVIARVEAYVKSQRP